MGYRDTAEQLLVSVEEACRYASYKSLLPSVVDSSNRALALRTANILGFILATSPISGRHSFRVFRKAFGLGWKDAFARSCGWFSGPYRDFVIFRRLLDSREDPADPNRWPIREINREFVDQLRDARSSYIVTTGHFCRVACISAYFKRITPNQILLVAAQRQPFEGSIFQRRMSIQFGQMMDALKFCRNDEIEIIEVGGKTTLFKTILERLQEPGTTAFLSVDAPWDKHKPGGIMMPFAGHKEAYFAMGAARLAKMARVPIINSIAYLDENEQVVVEWKPPIRFDDGMDEISEEDLMQDLLHEIEIAVGRRPEQYVLEIGSERRWNHHEQCWE
jgi:lauroyl/myristoyl acyltransferase